MREGTTVTDGDVNVMIIMDVVQDETYKQDTIATKPLENLYTHEIYYYEDDCTETQGSRLPGGRKNKTHS